MALLLSYTSLILGISASNTNSPNIVFMLTDDLGWNSMFNNAEHITPTLDAMVSESLLLNSFYVYKYCAPSRASFLTGRFPYKSCATRNNLNPASIPEGIHLGYTYIAKKLQNSNPPYISYHVGKWHQGFFTSEYTPFGRGFNQSFGFLTGGEDHYNQHNFWGCNDVPAVDLYHNDSPAFGQNGSYNAYQFTEMAVEYITKHVQNTPTNPLFLYYALHNTHAPLQAPQSTIDMYKYNQTKRNIFDAMVTVVDQSVKNVTDALKTLNIWNNTLFIWTTDNGSPVSVAGSNYPFRGSKGNNFEGGVHVPLLMSGGRVTSSMKGKSLNGLMHITDWYATFCFLADVDPNDDNPQAPAAIDSLNMWPYLSGAVSQSPRNIIVHDHLMYSNVTKGAIRSGRYKLVMMNESEAGWYGQFSPNTSWNTNMVNIHACSVEKPCLFDIVNDVTEHNDLSNELPQITQSMIDLFYSYNKEYHGPKHAPPDDKQGYCSALHPKDFVFHGELPNDFQTLFIVVC
eukprot:997352_1